MKKRRFDGTTMLDVENEYDWKHVMEYAQETQWVTGAIHPKPDRKHGFVLDDITSTVASVLGERDADGWIAVVRLRDGTFGAVRAWCDYTGWGCQEGGDSARSDKLDLIVRWWLSADERLRLEL